MILLNKAAPCPTCPTLFHQGAGCYGLLAGIDESVRGAAEWLPQQGAVGDSVKCLTLGGCELRGVRSVVVLLPGF